MKQRSHKSKSGKISHSSFIRITNKQHINKMGQVIYNDFENDHIGLLRKYNIYRNISNKC